MKKSTLLNAEISAVVARLGHTDSLTIGDAGLPVPQGPQRIDMALTQGVPGFLQVVAAVTDEMQVESVILAEEMLQHNVHLHGELIALIERLQRQQGNSISVTYISHQQFKERTQSCQAVVRSGECSPYANIILNAGVTF